MQSLSLVLIFIASIFICYGEKGPSPPGHVRIFSFGVLCISVASVLSAVGSVLSELALAGDHKGRDSYLFSAELGVYSSLAVVVLLVFTDLGGEGTRLAREVRPTF